VPDRDRTLVLIPLPGVGTLELTREAYEAALRPITAETRATSPDAGEPLIDAEALSRSLNLPKSCVYEKARTGAIPSVRVGKHVRFRRSQVLEALGATARVAVGRA
jgi:excisionase family DNA binding protein